jgi:hypothetical protein
MNACGNVQLCVQKERIGMPNFQVALRGDTIVFPSEFKPQMLDGLQYALWRIDQDTAIERVQFDFSNCVRTFPNAMVPAIAGAAWLRDGKIVVEYAPPGSPNAERLFRHTNWSHYLDPRHFARSEGYTDRHLAVVDFRDSTKQHQVVQNTIDLVHRSTKISRSALNGLEWCINEITDNVLNHSESSQGGWIQLAVFPERIAISIADIGHGLLKSLKPRYSQLRTDMEAIEFALRPGVTRDPALGQGNGLKGSLRLANAFGGQFSISSWEGYVRWAPNAPLVKSTQSDPFPGTVVDVQMQYDQDIDVGLAISGGDAVGYQPRDVVEEKYLADDLNTLHIRMAEETDGFGNRGAGGQMRTKLLNILSSHPSQPIVLDWTGISVIASSYADEFIGKLFLELGPLGFMQRIRVAGAERLVRTIVDKAISDRVTQGLNQFKR